MRETNKDLTQNADRVPVGVALKCDHNCCGGTGSQPLIIEQALIEALKTCVKEVTDGLEKTIEKVRSNFELKSGTPIEEIDSDLAEDITCLREVEYTLGIALETKGGAK